MQSPELLERARRQGPVPYSAQGCSPPPDLPPGAALVAWLTDAIDEWWAQLGSPDPFTLVEVGAGDGTRAAALLGAGPRCLTALRYVLVEDDPHLRHQHATYLPIESPVFVLGPVEGGEDEEVVHPVTGIGPLVTSLAETPMVDGPAVVVPIGWLSRQPSDRIEWRDGAWWEVRLSAGPEPSEELSELLIPLDEPRAVAAERLAGRPDRPDGARFALLDPAVEWLARTFRVAETGRLAVIDRWSTVTSPLTPGEVPALALDQLSAVRRPVESTPEEIFPKIGVVTWRLG